MAIFEIGDDAITPVPPTSFSLAGVSERYDLQRLLRDRIDVVAPDILVIAEEFGDWMDSRRRIDLLGLDKDANLVVIELKRTEDGGHMELQAVRYAAMVSTLTAERAVEVFGSYLKSRGMEDDPEERIVEFLQWDELDEDRFAQDVRIVLVSANFSRELTTAVMWLNEKELDVRCVRIRPYNHSGRTLIDVQQVIPLAEAADYQVKLREKKRRERNAKASGIDFTRYDVTIGGQTHPNQWKRNAILLVAKAACERGTTPEDFAQALAAIGRNRIWRVIDGEVNDVDKFKELATSSAANGGSPYDDRRWHTRDGDLIVHRGRTYALSNQWGRRWPRAMELLKERFPELGLEWTPAAA